jgi:hypothetical protein
VIYGGGDVGGGRSGERGERGKKMARRRDLTLVLPQSSPMYARVHGRRKGRVRSENFILSSRTSC